jgi:hypothetical protein
MRWIPAFAGMTFLLTRTFSAEYRFSKQPWRDKGEEKAHRVKRN